MVSRSLGNNAGLIVATTGEGRDTLAEHRICRCEAAQRRTYIHTECVCLGCYAAIRLWLGRVPGSTQGARGCCLLLSAAAACSCLSRRGGLSRDANGRPRPPCGEAAPNCFNRHSLTEAGGLGLRNGCSLRACLAFVLARRARYAMYRHNSLLINHITHPVPSYCSVSMPQEVCVAPERGV